MHPADERHASIPNLAILKRRQQAIWASGDSAVIGTTLQIVGEVLAESADIRAGERVLDVAAGNGNATLAAARRFADVTSTDYAPALLDKGIKRAIAEGLDVKFEVADAEELPFADGSFDTVLSTFGAMFAVDHRRWASEMLRVTRSGGKIGLANWTPEGFIGRLFKVIGVYIPPQVGFHSPPQWGTEPYIVERLGSQALDIRCQRRFFSFRYRSPLHWLQVFRDSYGPVKKAFEALDGADQCRLERDIVALLSEMNTAGSASLVVPGEYLEVVVIRH
ncbi:MAG: class I SAM-dependent methyltransferase [Pseudoxanthomonas sp.]